MSLILVHRERSFESKNGHYSISTSNISQSAFLVNKIIMTNFCHILDIEAIIYFRNITTNYYLQCDLLKRLVSTLQINCKKKIDKMLGKKIQTL